MTVTVNWGEGLDKDEFLSDLWAISRQAAESYRVSVAGAPVVLAGPPVVLAGPRVSFGGAAVPWPYFDGTARLGGAPGLGAAPLEFGGVAAASPFVVELPGDAATPTAIGEWARGLSLGERCVLLTHVVGFLLTYLGYLDGLPTQGQLVVIEGVSLFLYVLVTIWEG